MSEPVHCSCGKVFDWENWDRKTIPIPKGVHESMRHLVKGHTLLRDKSQSPLARAVDELLEIIERQLAHQEKQEQTNYSRGFVKGIRWTKDEIMKVFEK